MPRTFQAGNWFYIVAGNVPPVYDSNRRVFVQADDPDYLAFLVDGNVARTALSTSALRDFLVQTGVRYQDEGRPADFFPQALLCRAIRGSQIVGNNALVPIAYNVTENDTHLIHDNNVAADEFVIPEGETGFYDSLCEVLFAESTTQAPGTGNTGDRLVSVRVNGEFRLRDRRGAANTGDSIIPLSGDLYLEAGDVVQFAVGQDSGGSMTVRSRATLRRSSISG